MWHQYLYYAVLVACWAYVFLVGGPPEKIAVMIMVIGSLATDVLLARDYQHMELGLFAIDALDQLAMLWLMLRADRFWPIYLFGLHLLELLIAVAKGLVPAISPGIYARAEHVLAYLLLAIICLGAKRHRNRCRKLGTDPSWSTS